MSEPINRRFIATILNDGKYAGVVSSDPNLIGLRVLVLDRGPKEETPDTYVMYNGSMAEVGQHDVRSPGCLKREWDTILQSPLMDGIPPADSPDNSPDYKGLYSHGADDVVPRTGLPEEFNNLILDPKAMGTYLQLFFACRIHTYLAEGDSMVEQFVMTSDGFNGLPVSDYSGETIAEAYRKKALAEGDLAEDDLPEFVLEFRPRPEVPQIHLRVDVEAQNTRLTFDLLKMDPKVDSAPEKIPAGIYKSADPGKVLKYSLAAMAMDVLDARAADTANRVGFWVRGCDDEAIPPYAVAGHLKLEHKSPIGDIKKLTLPAKLPHIHSKFTSDVACELFGMVKFEAMASTSYEAELGDSISTSASEILCLPGCPVAKGIDGLYYAMRWWALVYLPQSGQVPPDFYGADLKHSTWAVSMWYKGNDPTYPLRLEFFDGGLRVAMPFTNGKNVEELCFTYGEQDLHASIELCHVIQKLSTQAHLKFDQGPIWPVFYPPDYEVGGHPGFWQWDPFEHPSKSKKAWEALCLEDLPLMPATACSYIGMDPAESYTVWVCNAGEPTNHYVIHQYGSRSEAKKMAIDACASDWEADPSDLMVLGVIKGEVEIEEWNDG